LAGVGYFSQVEMPVILNGQRCLSNLLAKKLPQHWVSIGNFFIFCQHPVPADLVFLPA